MNDVKGHQRKSALHSITLSARSRNDFWNGKSERLCGLEVDRQLELGWLLDWQVSSLSTAQELHKLRGHKLSKGVDETWAVGDKAAFLRCFRPLIDSR